MAPGRRVPMVASVWAISPPKTEYLPDLSMIYQNYPLSANTTRVLRILPATTPDQSEIISCRLSVISLDPAPEYRALSYVWGPPSGKRFILIDNTRFRVRKICGTILLRHGATDMSIPCGSTLSVSTRATWMSAANKSPSWDRSTARHLRFAHGWELVPKRTC
jgi:hypothetical protein